MAPLIETRSTDEHVVRKRIIAEDDEKQSAQSGIAVGGEGERRRLLGHNI
uniref:Uncharacterized protein n=1 Tax=Oryza glaberrima TaxID=4538 RepID=I1R185_ORYGL